MINEKKKHLIEIIGIATVVASLVFVGMQLLLDRRIAIADQYFNRGEAAISNLRSRIESDAYFDNQEQMWELGDRPSWWDESSELAALLDSGELSVRSLNYQILEARISLLGFDNNYFQYQQGLLNEEIWQGNRIGIRSNMERSEVYKSVFLASRRFISTVIQEIANGSDL